MIGKEVTGEKPVPLAKENFRDNKQVQEIVPG